MDLKGLGYLISSVSVAFLGVVAWPAPDEPQWKAWAVAIGMATSILGMGVRFLSHLQDRSDIKRAAHNQPPKGQTKLAPRWRPCSARLRFGLGLVELGKLLVEMAHRRIARLCGHLPALRGALQMERAITRPRSSLRPYARRATASAALALPANIASAPGHS